MIPCTTRSRAPGATSFSSGGRAGRAMLASGLVTLSACASAGIGRGAPAPDSRAALRYTIDSLVSQPKFANAHWGVLVVDPARGDTLYSHNAGKLFMPASNQKIVTGAVALAQLGPEYQYTTAFATRGEVRGGVLHGDLLVIGTGDPTMSTRMRGDVMLAMRAVADSLRARDIRYISGRLARDGDAFPDANYGFGWGWDDFDAPYSAGVDELFFNEGAFELLLKAPLRVGGQLSGTVRPDIGYPQLRVLATAGARPDSVTAASDGRSFGRFAGLPRLATTTDSASGIVTVTGQMFAGDSTRRQIAYRDPAAAYLYALHRALAEQAVIVEGGLDTRAPSDSAAEALLDTLFVLRSPALREILPAFEKPSQNQIGEILLKTLGREKAGVGTADSGRAVIERQLTEWGVPSSAVAVRDGSGLSRHDYITPEAIVRILDAMRQHEHFLVFRDALPIAGVDGTIANRMRGSAAAGNVRAKTGSVDKARSLSGYVTTADGRQLIFSVLANNWTTAAREVTDVADLIAIRLAELRQR